MNDSSNNINKKRTATSVQLLPLTADVSFEWRGVVDDRCGRQRWRWHNLNRNGDAVMVV
jgi:hypothetical protein